MPPKKSKAAAAAAAAAAVAATPLDNITIAFQGGLSKTQAEFKTLVGAAGGSIASSVTKAVTHLVTTGEDVKAAGTKVKAAEKNGIFIVSEDWLLKTLEKGVKEDEASYAITAKRKADDTSSSAASASAASSATTKPKRSKKADDAAAAAAAAAPAPAPAAAAAAASSDSGTKVKVIRKGKAPVDMLSGKSSSHHVIEVGDNVYNCMLNQTNIGGVDNNNKFYVIQALEADGGGGYCLFTRWGRVGEDGQKALQPCGSSAQAISAFEKKFREKTQNSWNDRANFVPHDKKYTLIEIDYGDEEEDKKKAVKRATNANITRKESTLHPAVQQLVRLIFDMKMMSNTLVEMEYDIEKMPLGKLKKSTIMQGYEVLKQIEEAIKDPKKGNIAALSGRFYTLIPHSYGRSTKPPAINTEEMLKTKMQMLEALADIEIATNLIAESEESDSDASILDLNYGKLKCNIAPVTDPAILQRIHAYVKNSWESGTGPKVVNVYALDREGEAARFAAQVGNRKMLWHGSRLTNYVGIISQGLRIAPPEAPCSGYRFGKGVYFANAMSLSARYCRSQGSQDFCMLLADVALGKTAELDRDQFMTTALPGSQSTHALGRITNDPSGNQNVDGCVWPLGKLTSAGISRPVSCHEDQFVVYDVKQCHLQYLLHLKL